jgi:hypothetical protein
MRTFKLLGLAALTCTMLAPDSMAQRGGAVRGGMRGAMVGGMVGGSSGAQTGARVGAVAGATRGVAQRTYDRQAMDAEAQTRTQYQSTAEYQSAQHSDFSEAPPEVLITSEVAESAAPATSAQPATPTESAAAGEEAVIQKNGKPVVAITYPGDWKQKQGERYVSAVSPDGQAYSMIALVENAPDVKTGITKVKQGLDKYLQDISYDELTKTERGALLVTGTGKAKKSGVDVVFAAGVFDAGGGQLTGVAFVADKDVEEHYKETVKYICQTIRGEQDLNNQRREAAKPVTGTP